MEEEFDSEEKQELTDPMSDPMTDMAEANAVVITSKPEKKSDDGCLNKCFRCLANIPAPTLLSWVLLVVSVCACAASLMVAAERTRMLLEDDDLAQGSGGSTHTMHFMFQKELLVGFTFSEIVCLSVLFGMLFLGTLFLIVAILSSGKTSAHVFDTSGKNICARALNVIAIVLMALLDIAWIACCTILTVPLVFLIIVHILYSRDDKCINLKNFALASEDRIYCDGNFTTFHTKAWEALICYIVSYIGAILVAFSMTLFLLCAGANYVHLRENRFAVLNAYKNGVSNSRNSWVVETKM